MQFCTFFHFYKIISVLFHRTFMLYSIAETDIALYSVHVELNLKSWCRSFNLTVNVWFLKQVLVIITCKLIMKEGITFCLKVAFKIYLPPKM